jgi:hypothetical protein
MPRRFAVLLPAFLFALPAVYGQCTTQALQLAQQQLNKTIGYMSATQFPQATIPPANHWNQLTATEWTSGFFPGLMWYIYQQSLDSSLFSRAQTQTSSMAGEATDASDHDIGFRILASYGNAYAVTHDPSYMSTIQTAAATMATLYRPAAGVIESWPNYDSNVTVIIDGMMTLELLFYASANGGDPNWYNMAVSHANKTMANHVRSDGSTFQAVDYNPTTGAVVSKFTSDGYSASSTWSRGQAWGLAGFTIAYRYTHDPNYLATAQKLADYFIANLPPDFVPWWDFSQPNTYRDSSAAAIASSGLIELSTYMTDPTLQQKYFNAAMNIQASLSNPALYLGDPTKTDGLLIHGTYSVPVNYNVDTSLIWGDYFFVQGCYRASAPPAQVLNAAATTPVPGQVALTWNAQSGSIRYNVKRSTTTGGPYTYLAPPPVLTTNSFTDKTVAANTTYYYVISASNPGGEGPNSTEVVITATSVTPTSTGLVSSLNPSVSGQSVTFTATVTAGTGTPAGTVNFKDGSTVLATVTLGANAQASYSTSSLSVGSHSITAAYAGNANFAASTSPAITQNVSAPSLVTTTTTVTSSLNPSVSGQPVTFTASVTAASGTPAGTVNFLDGSTVLTTVTLGSNAQATYTTSSLSVGSHSITAAYSGNATFAASTSGVITQTVTAPAKTNTSTKVTSSQNPSRSGQQVTFTATISESSSATPTGTMRFLDGTTTLATVNINGNSVTYRTSSLSIGSHSITAVYSGDQNFNGSTSPALTQTVRRR